MKRIQFEHRDDPPPSPDEWPRSEKVRRSFHLSKVGTAMAMQRASLETLEDILEVQGEILAELKKLNAPG